MKLIAEILLTILVIPVFLILMFSINIRFQLLTPLFWTSTFDSGKVYSQISSYLNNKLETNVISEGGKIGDVVVLSNFLSEASIRGFVEDNLVSFLTYANGHSKEITVTVPFSATHVPKNYGISDLGSTSLKMSLQTFLKQFHINGISDSKIYSISKYGNWSWLITIFSFLLFITICILEYLLIDPGKKLIPLGIGILISGVIATISSFVGGYLGYGYINKFVGSQNMAKAILAILLPPLIVNIVKIWAYFGILGIVAGVLLFFIGKPAINKSK